MTNYEDRIVDAFYPSFFKDIQESTDDAFMKAKLVTDELPEPERQAARSQLRHALMEKNFRRAARNAGYETQACPTDPRGSHYSLVTSKGVYLIRCNIQKHCGIPRATKFRKERAAVNAWLDPLQLNLFFNSVKPPADWLCAMLVVTAYSQHGDSSLPAYVGLGVPRADLSNWVSLVSLTDLISRYHDLQTAAQTTEEAPIQVKDNAVPKLKRRP